ncbi:MAG: hypothetical protein J6Q30_04975 [Oscillospiraceae bacterium]|nr:hypothetical protein [Oscillospiraceae bacterium]
MDWGIIIKLGILCAAIFAVQLAVCLKASRVMTRLWPVIILTGLEIVCGIIVLAVGFKTETGAVVSSFAGSQMLLTAVLLIPVDVAWVVYGIIWAIKKIIEKITNKSEV